MNRHQLHLRTLYFKKYLSENSTHIPSNYQYTKAINSTWECYPTSAEEAAVINVLFLSKKTWNFNAQSFTVAVPLVIEQNLHPKYIKPTLNNVFWFSLYDARSILKEYTGHDLSEWPCFSQVITIFLPILQTEIQCELSLAGTPAPFRPALSAFTCIHSSFQTLKGAEISQCSGQRHLNRSGWEEWPGSQLPSICALSL